MEMLKADLMPKGNINLIKFGAYILDNTPVHLPMKNIDCEVIIKQFMGIRYHSSKFIDFLLNEPLTGFCLALVRKITSSSLFTKYTIPYAIYGGTKFYQRREIKDVLAYFHLIVNTKDDVSTKEFIFGNYIRCCGRSKYSYDCT